MEAKNAGWLIGGRVAQMLLSLIVGILSARYLGPGNYGVLRYGTAWITFFCAFSNLGINSVIVKELLDKPKEEGKTLGTALTLRFASGVLSSVIVIGCALVINYNEPVTIAVVALQSLGLVFNTFELINYWFQSKYKSKVTAIATLIAYAVASAYKLVLLAMGKDVRWFAFATSVDYIALALALWFAYKKNKGPSLGFSLGRAKEILGKSYHYILSSVMVAAYTQTDKVMLKEMLDDAEVGYYSAASSVCSMWVFVLAAIIDSMYPTILKLHSSDKGEYEKKNKQLYAVVFYVSCAVSVFFFLFGDFAIQILYGSSYSSASGALKIVTWYTAFSYLGVARNAWIVSEGKQKYLKYMYLGAAIVNVLLNLLFIPYMGASGAALASLITQISTSILLPMCFKEMRPNAKLMIDAILLRGVF
ncbi:MAG: flippase [Ruminococcaceae bacterium]|nr:flippase [Oscillospiraceae bacterium]